MGFVGKSASAGYPISDSDSEGAQTEADERFEDWNEDEDEEEAVKSLFNHTQTLPSVRALLKHDLQHFYFDLFGIAMEVCENDIAFIKLVNYIRSQKLQLPDLEAIKALVRRIYTKEFLVDDRYMIPIIQDDALLFSFGDIFDFSTKGLLDATSNEVAEKDVQVEAVMGELNLEKPSSEEVARILVALDAKNAEEYK
jgi:hypothetical protein